LRAAVASQAIMVHPDSPHYYPGTLGNQPVAVQFHAGSHYVALRLLEGYLPEAKLNLVHYGSPAQRFEALMNGEVAAAALMEPWITLAEKIGCRAVCEGHYLGAENASDNMDAETFAAINRAVVNAVDRINADKRKYLHYLIDDPRFAPIAAQYGGVTPEDFHLPRLRYSYNTPYSDEIVEDTYNWMQRWDLLGGASCSTDQVDNRLAQPTSADD
jgi:NitT/TauT family transport system substrate-binding protein